MTSRKRLPAAGISLAYFLTQVIFLYLPETAAAEGSIWKQRREATVLLAALPGPGPVAATALPAAVDKNVLPAWLQNLPPQAEVQRTVLNPAARRWAVLLQDLHGQEEAQRNSARILDHLSRAFTDATRSPLFVGLEGAQGAFDFAPYRRGLTPEVAGKTADHFLSQGLIAGPQAFGLTDTRASIAGMENAGDYLANVAALRRARARQGRLSAWVKNRRALWTKKRDGVFPPALRRIDEAVQEFHAGALGAAPYLETLAPHAPLGPAARRYLDLSRREKTLDFAAIERERESVLTRLVARLSAAGREDILRAAAACRAGAMTPLAFYRWIEGLCRRQGIAFSPGFSSYMDYLADAEALDREALLAELESVETAAGRAFFQHAGVKALWEEGAGLRLLERLATQELTAREWDRYQAAPPEGPAELLPPFEDFYRLALKRNAAMAAKPAGEGAVLVAGGFHTADLSARLRRAGWNVLVISPKISSLKKTDYLALFSVDKSPLDRVLAGEKLFLVYPPLLGATAPPPGFEREKARLDGRWELATGGASTAQDVLAALRLEEAQVLGETPVENGLTTRRIRIPAPAAGLPQGTAILHRELAPTRDFVLLLDAERRPLAIFPEPGAEPVPWEWKFWDLSPFYAPLPEAFGPENKTAWTAASAEADRMERLVLEFRRERDDFRRMMPFGLRPSHALMERARGRLRPVMYTELSQGLPRRAFRRTPARRALLALPPTVYAPRANGTMDQPYIELLQDRIAGRGAAKERLDRVLVGGVGSGFDLIAAAWTAADAGFQPSMFGFDLNPIALATARRNAARAGIQFEGRVHDNFAAGGEPVFPGPFDLIAWNLPVGDKDAPTEPSLTGIWDAEAPAATVPRALRSLPGLLAPGGEAILWHPTPPEIMEKELARAGLRILEVRRRGGDPLNPIVTFAYAIGRADDGAGLEPSDGHIRLPRRMRGQARTDVLWLIAGGIIFTIGVVTGHWAPLTLALAMGGAHYFKTRSRPEPAVVENLSKQTLRDTYARYTDENWPLPKILKDLERLARQALGELDRRPPPDDGLAGVDLSPRQQDFLRALAELLVNLRPVPPDSAAAELAQMQEALRLHPRQSRALLRNFENRFGPTAAEELPLELPVDPYAQAFFRDAAAALEAVVKTNFFVEESHAVSFRLDPAKLAIDGVNPFQDANRFPERLPYLPYAVLFSRVNGGYGFHVRFGDIARGGVREKIARAPGQFVTGILDEAYRLAAVQDEKNVTIPADGAKAVYRLEPGAPEVGVALGVLDGFLRLMKKDARVVYRGPAGQEVDFLLFGPDVGTGPFPPLVKALGRVLGFQHLWRFHMTGDPFLGIPHDKNNLAQDLATNHVTSLGVVECLRLALFELRPDRPDADVRLVVTGDPGGDVAGGVIFHAFRTFGERAKVTAVLGYRAVAIDPEGLDRAELLRLQGDQSRPRGIEEYRAPEGKESVFPVEEKDGQRWVSFPAPVRRGFNRLTEAALLKAGEAAVEDGALRVLADRVHLLLRADALIPADVRERVIRRDSVPLLFDESGAPNYPIIDYGANIWAEQAANEGLEQRGVIVVRDSLANSIGVEISALVENHINFLYDMEEMTEPVKAAFLAHVLESLRVLMGRKYWATRMAQLSGGEGFFVSTHSRRISQEVIRLSRLVMESPVLTAAALQNVDWMKPYYRPFVPPMVDERRLFHRNGGRDAERAQQDAVYNRFLLKLAARGLAMNVVYSAGPDYVADRHARTKEDEASIVFAYAQAAAEAGPQGIRNGLWLEKDTLLLDPSPTRRFEDWQQAEARQQMAAQDFNALPVPLADSASVQRDYHRSRQTMAQTRPARWLWSRLSAVLPEAAGRSRTLEAAFTATLELAGFWSLLHGFFALSAAEAAPPVLSAGSLWTKMAAAMDPMGPGVFIAVLTVAMVFYSLHEKGRRGPAVWGMGAALTAIYAVSAGAALWLPGGGPAAAGFAAAGWVLHFSFDRLRVGRRDFRDDVKTALKRLSPGLFRVSYTQLLPDPADEARAALQRLEPVRIEWTPRKEQDLSRRVMEQLLEQDRDSPLARLGDRLARTKTQARPGAYNRLENRVAYWSGEALAETTDRPAATAAVLRALLALRESQNLAASNERLAQMLPWVLLGLEKKTHFAQPAAAAAGSVHIEDVSILSQAAGIAEMRQTPWARALAARVRAARAAGTPVVFVAARGDTEEIRGRASVLLGGSNADLRALPAADYADSYGGIRLSRVARALGRHLPGLGKNPPLALFTDDPARFADLTRFALAQLTITFLDGREVRLLQDFLDRFRAQMLISTNA